MGEGEGRRGGGGELWRGGPLTHFKNIHQCLESAEGVHSLGAMHHKNYKRLKKKRKENKQQKKKQALIGQKKRMDKSPPTSRKDGRRV